MNNRLSSFNVKDKGSNYPFNKSAPKALPQRSLFDLSYLNSFTAEQGALIPFYFQHSLMNEDYTFGNEAVCRVVNPPTVPLLSRQRIYFHLFWCSYTQLWKKAHIFFDKGRLTMTPPESILLPTFSAVRGEVAKRGSLFDYLGINVVNSGNETSTVEVPALKFMMYLKVWRDYYCNKRIFSAWLKRMYSTTSQEWYRILGEFLFPVESKLGIKITDLLSGNIHIKIASTPAGNIDCAKNQRFIHRKDFITVSFDSLLVSHRFKESLSEANSDIFNGVMIINESIAVTFYIKIKSAVS